MFRNASEKKSKLKKNNFKLTLDDLEEQSSQKRGSASDSYWLISVQSEKEISPSNVSHDKITANMVFEIGAKKS